MFDYRPDDLIMGDPKNNTKRTNDELKYEDLHQCVAQY